MANTPISGFTSGAPAQSGDEHVVARSGANYKLTNDEIRAFFVGTANSFTTSQNITPSSDVVSLALRRNGAAQTSNILEIQTEANAFLAGFDKAGLLTLGAATRQTGIVKFAGTTSGVVSLSAADAAGTWTMKLPTSAGTNGYVLQTDGSGNTSWVAQSGGPGGLDTQVQYNKSGVFGGDANFTWNETTKLLTITGLGTGGGSNTGGVTVSGGPITLSGNISANAWTTNGIRFRGVPATLTDLTSSGTVATAYTNVYGGNTIAASNSTTFTDYYTTWISPPTAGTNVTFTNRWAMGVGGSLQVRGGTVTTNTTPALDLTQTWNAGAVSFTGLRFVATDTASAASSGVMDLLVGSTSILRVGKAASNALTLVNSGVIASASTGGVFLGSSGGTPTLIYASGISLGSAATLGWSSASTPTTSPDTLIRRVSSGVIQFGTDGGFPPAYTLQISNAVSGATNVNGPNFTIRAGFSTGSGVGGSLIFQVSPAGSSGVTPNAGVSALTIAATRVITIADAFDLAFNATTGSKIGTDTTQKIGFWNATPIVQPTTAVTAATVAATGTGDVVAASTTFDGYTIPQVVKALRNAGLLA